MDSVARAIVALFPFTFTVFSGLPSALEVMLPGY